MGIDRKDLRDEEINDRKVGVRKDINRIADGDVSGTLRDSIDEIKSDVRAADDKIEKAFTDDDDEIQDRRFRKDDDVL